MSLIDDSRIELPRRVFLKQAATVASGLAIALYLPGGMAATDPKAPAPASEFEPNAWVRIFPDGTVKLVVHKHDSGTGTQTALAACVAEELDVNPMTVQVITPEDPFSRLTFIRSGRFFHWRQHQCFPGIRAPAHGRSHGAGATDHGSRQAVESQP